MMRRFAAASSREPILHCVEMEGAAIALVAYSNQIPCLVIRSMSDNANGDAGMSFDTFETIAADHSANLLLTMLDLA